MGLLIICLYLWGLSLKETFLFRDYFKFRRLRNKQLFRFFIINIEL
jgi:hypothetical protein